MLPTKCWIYGLAAGTSDGEYTSSLFFDNSALAQYVSVDDIIRDSAGNRYKIITWNNHPTTFSNDGTITLYYIDEDVMPVESDSSADTTIYTEGEVDVRPKVQADGTISNATRGSFENFTFFASFTWTSAMQAGNAELGDYICDSTGKLYEIVAFGSTNTWDDVEIQEVDKEGILPTTSGGVSLFRPTKNFKLYMGGYLNNDQFAYVSNRDSFLLDHNAGIGELGGGSLAAVFAIDVEPVDGGIVGMKTYHANTVPANAHLESAVSDTSTIRVHIGLEGSDDSYSPTATINDVSLSYIEETNTKRWFVGYADINLTPGDNYVTIVSSSGAEDAINITYSAEGPSVTDVQFGSYPGSQTELKENDQIDVTISTDLDAVEVEILESGANKSITTLSVTDGSATGTIDISGLTGTQTITVRAKNQLGTAGSDFTSTATVVLNQTYPSITGVNITYPTDKLAFGDGDSGTLEATVSDFDTIVYNSSHFSIPDDNTYAQSKTITNTHIGYIDSDTNISIQATRTANNAVTSQDILAKIATTTPTAQVTITGNPIRLQSSPSGVDYEINILANQELKQAPSMNASIGSWQGDWTQADAYTWKRDLRIVDTDSKGTGTFSGLDILGLSNLAGDQITNGDNYDVGGFVARTITFPAFSRVAAIGTRVVNEDKTAAQIVGGSVLTLYKDNQDRSNGYYIANSDGTYDPTGEYLGLSDQAFAGANTTGTLQASVQEEE